MDLISVIVPVYNVEQYIEKCVESIINQTYRNLEIILVNDGSNDSSGEICDNYAKKDERIICIHQENKGLSAARNKGLQKARGNWIAFVDSDDWIESNMFEILINHGVKYNADIVLCKFKSVYGDAIEKGVLDTNKISVFEGKELIQQYVKKEKDCIISPSVWDRLYSKEILEGITFPEGRLNEDICFTVEVFIKSNRSVYIDKSMYCYRVNRIGNITSSKFTIKRMEDNIILTEAAMKVIEAGQYYSLAREFFLEFYNFLSELYLVEKDVAIRKCIKEYRKNNKKKVLRTVLDSNINLKKRMIAFLNMNSPYLRKMSVDMYGIMKKNSR